MDNKLPSKEAVERLRERYPVGTMIELISMDDPYTTLEPGDKGVVDFIDDTGSIFVNWDSGSTLALIYGVDSYKKLELEVSVPDQKSTDRTTKRFDFSQLKKPSIIGGLEEAKAEAAAHNTVSKSVKRPKNRDGQEV